MPDGRPKRNTIRLGPVDKRTALSAKRYIEALVAARIGGCALMSSTLEWLRGLPPNIHRRLERIGLVDPAASTRYTLQGWLAEYFDTRADWKPRTRQNCIYVRTALEDHFGGDMPLCEVTQAEAEAVLEACPDAEWRLIFALCRYGGLRCPSEVLRLMWADIHWDKSRFTVQSPKLEHHDGGGVRTVPIFAELRPHLLEAFDLAELGAKRCIRRYRDLDQNLRTRLTDIIKRAGVKPWPKIFQNLRSTRETELVELFPVHVVTTWLGNSPAVANRHYLQTTEEHFTRATGETGSTATNRQAGIIPAM